MNVRVASDYLTICFKVLAIYHIISGKSEPFGSPPKSPQDVKWFNQDNDNLLYKLKFAGSNLKFR